MKKIVRLTESDLTRIVNKVINEQHYISLPDCKPGDRGQLVLDRTLFALSGPSGPFCKIISSPIPSTSSQTPPTPNQVSTKPSNRQVTPQSKPMR